MSLAIRNGTQDMDALISALDKFGAGDLTDRQRLFVEGLIESARETKNLQGTVNRSDAVIRVLSGTASDADRALLGFSKAADEASTSSNTLAVSASTVVSSLRSLQSFIPELAKANKISDDLGKAQEAFRQGVADFNNTPSFAKNNSDLVVLEATYARAKAEITGAADAQRDANEALAIYTDRSNLDVLSGQNRAIAVATQEYDALTTQLKAAGASQAELTAARVAFDQQLSVISRDFSAAGISEATNAQREANEALAEYTDRAHLDALRGSEQSHRGSDCRVHEARRSVTCSRRFAGCTH